MYLKFMLLTHTHTLVANKPEEYNEVVKIPSTASLLDSDSGPPTHTPGSTGAVFNINKATDSTKLQS